MRGPDLVGYPPSGLRWSGDSRDLFFEWRRPGEKDNATYVLSQNTTAPRRLTDDERKLAPPVGGAWDEARRRVVFAESGDIVVIDTVARTRQQVTRTTAPESSPRWARNDTAVTFVSQNNLFIVPLATGSIEQLTDVKLRRRETRDTDSQKFVREQEAALLQVTREAVEQRKAEEEKRKKDALPGIRDHRAPERGPTRVAPLGHLGVPGRSPTVRMRRTPSCRTTSPNRATPRTSRRGRRWATFRAASASRCSIFGRARASGPTRRSPARRRSRARTSPARSAGRCRWSRRTAVSSSPPRGPRTSRTAGLSPSTPTRERPV